MRRYAIYYAPHEVSPLWQFGCAVLGFDAAAFRDVDYPTDPIFQDPAALAFTSAPRRYGFHATLKAPFGLASDVGEDQLLYRLEAFAAEQAPFVVRLKLAALHDFLALVPAEPSARIHRLADDCVRTFDDCRAPMTAVERERRHPDRLEPRQLENLDRWGYPFVFDDFRFHMTLTGPVAFEDQIRLVPVLEEMFALVSPDTTVDGLSLFMQEDAEARFRLTHRFPFKAS